MTFDTEEQKKIMLEIFSVIQVPGNKLELMYNFKRAVLAAKIEEKGKEKDESPK